MVARDQHWVIKQVENTVVAEAPDMIVVVEGVGGKAFNRVRVDAIRGEGVPQDVQRMLVAELNGVRIYLHENKLVMTSSENDLYL